MDQAIIKFYRNLLKTGFTYAGEIESPSVFVNALSEGIAVCGKNENYMNLYIDIRDNTVQAMKYLCICEPTTNVAIEILCALATGKPLHEIKKITAESIAVLAERSNEELIDKAGKLIELMNRGIENYLKLHHNTVIKEATL